MPVESACPGCGRSLQLPAVAGGERVSCPDCDATLVAPPRPPAASDSSVLEVCASADESDPLSDEERFAVGGGRCECPVCGERISNRATRCPFCREYLDEEFAPEQPIRRDCVPHRSGMLVLLGLLSLGCMVLIVLAPIGMGLGFTTWWMARDDLRQMRTGEMDAQGEDATRGAAFLALVAAVLATLLLLFVGGMVLFVVSLR